MSMIECHTREYQPLQPLKTELQACGPDAAFAQPFCPSDFTGLLPHQNNDWSIDDERVTGRCRHHAERVNVGGSH
jgi:hypothetical protein